MKITIDVDTGEQRRDGESILADTRSSAKHEL
jgi:hypothetical protein